MFTLDEGGDNMTKLEELRAEKAELLKYREFLCQLNNTMQDSNEKQNTTKDKPKVKKLGVRPNGQNSRY